MSDQSELPLARFSSGEKPSLPIPYGSAQFDKAEQENIQRTLNYPLEREDVSSRRGFGGKNLSYITGGRVIQKANEIFGFNGWSTSIIDLSVDYCDKIDGTYNTGVTCVSRVTLKDGTQREDIGFGHAENQPYKYSAIDKAKKEAVTDATKRALRLFGNQLGLCLYDKDFVVEMDRGPKNSTRFPETGRLAPKSIGAAVPPQFSTNKAIGSSGGAPRIENSTFRSLIAASSFSTSSPTVQNNNPVGYIVKPTDNRGQFGLPVPRPSSDQGQNTIQNPSISNPIQPRPIVPQVTNTSETHSDNNARLSSHMEDSFLEFDELELSQINSRLDHAVSTNGNSLPTTQRNNFSGISMSASPAFNSAAASNTIGSLNNFPRSPNSYRVNPNISEQSSGGGNPDPKRHQNTRL